MLPSANDGNDDVTRRKNTKQGWMYHLAFLVGPKHGAHTSK